MTDRAPTVRAWVRGSALPGRGSPRRYARVLSGEGLLLEREPSNPAHSNAILVCTEDGPVGYIQRDKADILAPWLDKGWVYHTVCIQPALVRTHRGRRQVGDGSMRVRCVPVAPIARTRVARRVRELEDQT